MIRVFISYRRVDSLQYAGRLCDALVPHFGRDHVFLDVDTISPGEDFREVIRHTCSSCEVLLAVIGKQWATACDKNGERCLNGTDDYPRLEIATALQSGLRVIPVLVGGAEMPDQNLLPEDLKPLLFRNAWEISDKRFHQDAQLLIEALKKSFTAASPEPASAVRQRPSLFPLYGVILGKTSVTEIRALGATFPHISGMYQLKDVNFFTDYSSMTITRALGATSPHISRMYQLKDVNFFTDYSSKTIIESIMVSNNKPMPESWEALGFSWQNSFEEWARLLQSLGYSVKTQTKNSLLRMMTDDKNSAQVSGRIVWPHAHRIDIDFRPATGASRIGVVEHIYCTSR